MQGSKGIRQWLINLCRSTTIIHKITPSVNYNQCLNRLDIQLNKPTTQNTIKVPKVESTDKKTLFKNFGDQCNKQPNVPSLPVNNTESTLARSNYQPPTLVRYSRPRGNTCMKPLPPLNVYFNVFCQFFANKPKIFQIQFFLFRKLLL